MTGRRAVVTGIGVVSPIGIGRDRFWCALRMGTSGIRDVSLFDTAPLSSHRAAEVADFTPETWLGAKGLKYLDRSTQLAAAATALALDDARLGATAGDGADIGVALGTMFGSLESISRFDRDILSDGPRAVNPMAFPRTVINSPAGHVAIRFGLTGPNTTVSAGAASALQAVGYAVDFIQTGRADVFLAGGVEELTPAGFLGFHSARMLSGSTGGDEHSAPFDAGRNGFVLGEGAALVVVEERERALARGARIYGELLGHATLHDAHSPAQRARNGAAHVAGGIRAALRAARCEPDAIGCVSASANGGRATDAAEAAAIADVIPAAGGRTAVYSIKSMTGEALGASGAFQLVASLMTIVEGVVPPTVNFSAGDPGSPLGGVSASSRPVSAPLTLINATSCDGIHASLVVGRDEAQ